jgi:hypothetical protein
MKTNMMGTVAMVLGLTGLGACASTGTIASTEPATCNVEAAKTLVGLAAPDDASILRRTGSTILRRIAPGDSTTKDYRQERITVTVAEGRVVSAYCG